MANSTATKFTIVRAIPTASGRTRYMANWSHPQVVGWTYDALNKLVFEDYAAAQAAQDWTEAATEIVGEEN